MTVWTTSVAAMMLMIAAAWVFPQPSMRREGDAPDERAEPPGDTDSARPKMRRWTHRRPATFGPADIAAWVDNLSRSVRRGATLRQTLIDVTPSAPRLADATRPLHHHLARGASVPEACASWTQGLRQPDDRQLSIVGSVVLVAASHGGGAGEPLDRLAAAMRHAAADELERSAQSAQAKISARVLTLVPLAVLGLLVAVDGDVRAIVGSRVGAVTVASGLALNVAGNRWMLRIIEPRQR